LPTHIIHSPDQRFEDLGLIDALLRAVKAEGYERPTPIQTQAIPHVLAGRDLLGLAQTGTGKTAAFALPILQRLGQLGPSAAAGRRSACWCSPRPASWPRRSATRSPPTAATSASATP
jgi:superfamily II DNA/RNA helicase